MLLGIFLFGFITSLTAVSNNAPINVNMTVSVDNCTSGFIKYCTAVKLVIKILCY
jgi:hypothetical protein